MPTPDVLSPTPGELSAELERISSELLAMPLSNENKERRLTLNQRKLQVEATLAALKRQLHLQEREARRAELARALAALDPASPDRAQRRTLRRELAEVESEIALLQRG